MEVVDPTNTAMGPSLLLSDFMGCDSVYRYGYANPFYYTGPEDDICPKWAQGQYLSENLAYICSSLNSRISISYGYISPQLSRKIVKYQNPDIPSYHRWDKGAAADVIFHDMDIPPIEIAGDISLGWGFSRMITYSESPYICIGFNQDEVRLMEARGALYENRYMGVGVKPKHIKYPMGFNKVPFDSRIKKLKNIELPYGWIGAGYPTYHGGGRRQYHHIRVSKYTMVSDYLYNKANVHNGKENRPPSTKSGMARWMRVAKQAGQVYDRLCNRLHTGVPEEVAHLSITAAYNKHNIRMDWSDHFTLEVGHPMFTVGSLAEETLAVAEEHPLVRKAYIVNQDIPKLRMEGHPIW